MNKRFWDKVEKCKHKNLFPNYLTMFSCETPYCKGYEAHCKDCGAYISTCGCGYNSGIDGWPTKRRRKS